MILRWNIINKTTRVVFFLSVDPGEPSFYSKTDRHFPRVGGFLERFGSLESMDMEVPPKSR